MSVESNVQPVTLHWKPLSGATNASATTAASASGTVDLAQPVHRGALARNIKAAIDAWCEEHYDDGHRKHLGASLIGRECARELWYTFRWVKHKKFDGRMQRLFQRGHLEEGRFIEYLEGVGCTVEFVDTSAPMTLYLDREDDNYHWIETAKFDPSMGEDVTAVRAHYIKTLEIGIYPEYPQFRIEGCGGHFGGSLDVKITLPPSFGVTQPVVFLGEFKTWATKPFSELTRDGLQVKKHEHFCQMSVYGWKLGMRYGIYMGANKNDDDLHIEVVELDFALAQRLEAKADRIIQSPTPPQKLSESITFKTCSYCDMRDVCHENRPYERNCRSCSMAQPVANKEWYCHHFKGVIPADFIAKGCENWKPAV
jgi:hypothetical protein